MARKYSDLKKDPNIKTPIFAWVLNRSYVYIALFIVGFLILAGILHTGYNSYSEMMENTNKPSIYTSVEAEKPESLKWGEKVISTPPLDIKKNKWDVKSSSNPAHIVKINGCNNVGYDLPSSNILSSFSASGEGIKVGIQITNPGKSLEQFNKYYKNIKNCENVEISTYGENKLTVAFYNNSFLMIAGDTLINVDAKDNTQREELLDFYSDLLVSSLGETKCKAIHISDSDNSRSFYDDMENYKGLREKKEINTEVNTKGLPTPTNLTLNSIDLEKSYTEKPESPLPEDFPEMPKEESEPEIKEFVASETELTKNASYAIKDTVGPGCGWEWHGQVPPVFNDETLAENKQAAIQKTQDLLNENGENYIKENITWNLKTIDLYPKINDWNIYVKKVNNVYDKWDWLNTERENFAPTWYEYLGSYDFWKNFPDKKKKAQEDYNKELKQCESDLEKMDEWQEKVDKLKNEYNEKMEEYNQELEQWQKDKEEWDKIKEEIEDSISDDEEDNTETSDLPPEPEKPTKPKDLELPEKPQGCTVLPERPAILDQEKPEKPQAPEIPEGITIPNSWPQPEE